jgi:hypothetical protein
MIDFKSYQSLRMKKRISIRIDSAKEMHLFFDLLNNKINTSASFHSIGMKFLFFLVN